jgi:hypothetical protein
VATVRRHNADACWSLKDGGEAVIFDPWLVGSEIDLAPCFHEAWHTGPVDAPGALPDGLVVLSQPYSDHDHPATRAALGERAVVGVPGVRAPTLPTLDAAPHQHGSVRLWRVSKPWWSPPAYHAIVVAWPSGRAVVHAPHGLSEPHARAIRGHLDAHGLTLEVFAVSLRGYHLPWWLGGAVNPGPAWAERAIKLLAPRHTLQVHDEDKREVGLVARLARRVEPTTLRATWPTDAWGPWAIGSTSP